MVQCSLINNQQFSLEERETLFSKIHFDENQPHVLLKTCNRIELYWGEGEIPDHIIRHLYRVTSGLESGLIGERAIQGQVKLAYQTACENYRLTPQLHKLFQTAMHTGKRVRNETSISTGAVSHSQAVVDILKKGNLDLRNKVVSIIGVNKLTEDILKFLTARQAVQIFLSSRNFEKATTLAERFKGTAVPLQNKGKMLEFTDILISATSAPHTMVNCEEMPTGKNMLIFDLAFPRDIEAKIADMQGVTLYNLDDIERHAANNLSLRMNEVAKAEEIIEEEKTCLTAWNTHLNTIMQNV
ncbi:MAG: glutamyl-tRNA reductase [Bacteroidales bacterium]|jgi:glutamyl-tRNA reductase|nr:glutamyl-tRNA reductase [Bacteroidales bacterium]